MKKTRSRKIKLLNVFLAFILLITSFGGTMSYGGSLFKYEDITEGSGVIGIKIIGHNVSGGWQDSLLEVPEKLMLNRF